jgi:hypothetical protein
MPHHSESQIELLRASYAVLYARDFEVGNAVGSDQTDPS